MKSSGIRITTGIVFLFVVIIILASSSTTVLSKGLSMIDTEMQQAGSNATFVRTKMDFKDPQQMLAFPERIGGWEASQNYDWDHIKRELGADLLMVRSYRSSGSYQPLFLLIAQSSDVTSFHPPPVCYRAIGYDIDEETVVDFAVADSSWAKEMWRSEKEGNLFKGYLSAKKLIVSKSNPEGTKTERRALLYYFVKDSNFTSSNITMIEVSTIVPANSPYDSNLEMLKNYMGEIVPALFEPRQEKNEMIATRWINSLGVMGWILIIAILAVPTAIIFWPGIKSRFTRPKTEEADY